MPHRSSICEKRELSDNGQRARLESLCRLGRDDPPRGATVVGYKQRHNAVSLDLIKCLCKGQPSPNGTSQVALPETVMLLGASN